LQALFLILSAAVPALLAMAMLGLFAARYENVARSVRGDSARSSPFNASKVRGIEDRIRQAYERSDEKDVLRTVSFQAFSQVRGPVDPAKAEQALVDQPGYVAGSFRYDAGQRIVAFQYRGGREMARLYGFLLPAKADIMIALTPTFIEGADLPATSTADTGQSRAVGPTAGVRPATDAVSPDPDSEVLRTVSFQTLGQGQLDLARADSVLGEMPNYEAGSFRFDQEQQQITFQYRGRKAAATQFAFALQGKMLVTLRMKPTFEEETAP
jgi:hypothetical protein